MIHRVEQAQLSSPIARDGVDPGMLRDIADRLFGKRAPT